MAKSSSFVLSESEEEHSLTTRPQASDRRPGVSGHLAEVEDSSLEVTASDVVSKSGKIRLNLRDKEVARIIFTPEHPMLLYEIILLACTVHKTCPYNTVGTNNCYFFAGFLFKLLEKHSGKTPIVSPSNEAKLGAWKDFI